MQVADLFIQNAKQLICFDRDENEKKHPFWQMSIIQNGCLAVSGSKILAVGNKSDILQKIKVNSKTKIINAQDKVVTPGLIDPHTHPVFFLTREKEFEMRIQGKSYEEIAAAGGGIRSSVCAVRNASKDELKQKVRLRLCRFLELGTTTIEAKSGYGLSFEDEMKSLEVISELNDEQPLEMIPTFLGAHEIPDEYRENRQKYIELLIQEMIPYVSENRLAKFCDIFCEQGVYSINESRKILEAAKDAGLELKIHADQLHLTGATQLAVEMGAVSADHLEQLDDEGIEKIANSDTTAGLLPGSVFFLGYHHYPPGRKLVDAGATVCLATDFNPGSSMTQSMPLMMTLACLFMKLTPAEALTASTIIAAKSINCDHYLGNLREGNQADVVIWDADDYRQIPYYYGGNLVSTVIKKGELVINRS